MVSGMSPSVTGATRTVCGGCPCRPEFSPSWVEGSLCSNFCHANTAAAANAATIAILSKRLRRRGRAVSTVAGAERCVTSSGLRASFIP